VLQQVQDKYRRDHLRSVPFFDGLLAGEVDALVESFAGVPELHHPVRGRIKGERAFRSFVAGITAWMAERKASVESINFLITDPRAVEEVVLHLDGDGRRVALPVAFACDHDVADERILELRMYFSTRPLTGRRAHRPPVLQPGADLRAPGIVAEYQRALAVGDVEAIVAAFEPDGCLREVDARVHRGTGELRTRYEELFSEGGIPLEPCAVADDGRACALEYNMVAGSPEAGLAVYVRGDGGRLAAVRVYDDAGPPAG
jgi:hypothetical protein